MRHNNHGLRKLCECGRRSWAKCRHSWHFSFKHQGVHYRFSLDRHLGRHVSSKTEAEDVAGRLRVAIRDGVFAEPAPNASPEPAVETLESYSRTWLTVADLNLKVSTVRFYRDHLENHVFPVMGSRPIDSVTRKDCRELVTTVRKKGLKISTVRGIVRTLSTVLSQAVEDELLAANPALRMRKYLQRGDEPEAEVDPFPQEEAQHIVAVAREHFPEWHAWLLCALRTGLRPGELLALKWGDIDWRGCYVHVQRNLVRGRLTTPKNHQCRKVDLSRQLRAVLRLWRRQESVKCLELGVPRPEWIFASGLGTPLDESNVRKMFNRILDRAELHRRGPHQMRHTFASMLLQTGAPITYVSRQLGHRDSSVTLRVYAHWLPEATAEKGVNRLDSAEFVASSLQVSRSGALGRTA